MSKIKLMQSKEEYDILFSLEKDNNKYYAFKEDDTLYYGKTTKKSDIIKSLTKTEEELMNNVLIQLTEEGKNNE